MILGAFSYLKQAAVIWAALVFKTHAEKQICSFMFRYIHTLWCFLHTGWPRERAVIYLTVHNTQHFTETQTEHEMVMWEILCSILYRMKFLYTWQSNRDYLRESLVCSPLLCPPLSPHIEIYLKFKSRTENGQRIYSHLPVLRLWLENYGF